MKEDLPVTTSGQMAIGFFTQFIVNAIVITVATFLFPRAIVLGTANFNLGWAIFHSALILSIIGTLAVPLFENWQRMKGRMLTKMEWMVGYLVIDFVSLWIIARLPDQFGLGIAAWWIVLLMAIVFDFAQGMGMMMAMKPAKK